MLDDVVEVVRVASQEFVNNVDHMFDEFLDELSPAEQRSYARLGLAFALSELQKTKDKE